MKIKVQIRNIIYRLVHLKLKNKKGQYFARSTQFNRCILKVTHKGEERGEVITFTIALVILVSTDFRTCCNYLVSMPVQDNTAALPGEDH